MRLPWPRLLRRDVWLLAGQAAAGSVGYCVLLILGTRLASAADAGVVAGTLPAMAALFSVLILGERPSWRIALAIVLATAGVCLLALAGTAQTPAATPADAAAPERTVGILLVLAAVACEAFFILGQKRLSQPLHPVVMSTLMSGGGLLLAAVPAAALALHQPSRFTALALAGVAWYAWVPTVLGFLLWYAGAARSTGAQAAMSTVWLPVTAVLLSAFFLGETISAGQLLALGAVLAALLLSSRS